MIDAIGSTPAATTPRTQSGGTLGKQAFLSMLVTQLRNQDPLNPMQPDQMAAQLAQFSSLEELSSIDQTLQLQGQAQAAVLQAVNTATATSLLGRTVLVADDGLTVGAQGAEPLTLEVGGKGGAATLHVLDAAGREVATGSLGTLAAGRQEVGVAAALPSLPPGRYHFRVDVVGADGSAVAAQGLAPLQVDGLRYTSQGLVLTAGTREIPFESVLGIELSR